MGNLVQGIAHIGIAVHDTARALHFFCGGLGLEATHAEIIEAARLKVTFVPVGETLIEFLEPLDPEVGEIADFLATHGEGIHHLCFDVPDIVGVMRHLDQFGVGMVDRTPRPGALGASVAFVDRSASGGIVVELSEGQRLPPSSSPANQEG